MIVGLQTSAIRQTDLHFSAASDNYDINNTFFHGGRSKYDEASSRINEEQEKRDNEIHDCSVQGCDRVIINVSGQKFETQLRTLERFPETLLGNTQKREIFWDTRRNEFFLDRHRPSFQAILYFYQSGGRLRRPIEVPEEIFIDELEFYQIAEETIMEYKIREGFVIDTPRELPDVEWKRKLWIFCEEPDTSRYSKVFAIISLICILVSIINFCIETLPQFDEKAHCAELHILRESTVNRTPQQAANAAGGVASAGFDFNYLFFVLESICVAWFSMEFIMRFVSCPSKRVFIRDVMNIVDLLAIVPFFVSMLLSSISDSSEDPCSASSKSTGNSFIFVRVLRVFRVFKLSKHSQGLRILGLTIKSSLRELGMFFFFLLVAMVIFSSAAYYAEVGEPESQLTSIPGAFWWAIVTMTTVGYGDVTPVGVWGKLVGAFCVVAGVLTIALPVPVVVANFNNFYRHENGRGGYIS